MISHIFFENGTKLIIPYEIQPSLPTFYLFNWTSCIFFLGLGIADSDDDEDDAADMMDDDDAIFLPEKSANNRRIQPLIPDDFGK